MNLDRYETEETREDAILLAGLTAIEKRDLKRVLDCGSSGHVALGAMWRTLTPSIDGRLHASCPVCQSRVSRSAFTN